ncbi:3-dehydroquinate synthase [alpha proteobacterium U9-1i]|nr:3-dehydroquinate synthase [alpha proteobacterium U9-1i]
MSEKIKIDLDARSYDVHVGQGLLKRAGELIAPFAPNRRVFIVTDANVAKLHRSTLVASLEERSIANWTIVLPPGEEQKNFDGLERVSRQLLQAGISRNDLVVALGGGVIGDLAGLSAGITMRGIDFVQIPTTLLAQVDSSVGGKTAIDTPEGKNLIGLFHQPRLVLADQDVLATLSPRERLCGYAEIVKIGLISDPAFFAWCEANAARVLACDPAALTHAVTTAVKVKAAIVAADEREAGVRALLNLGHTFGHALETQAGYSGALLHGEAVGTGMALAYQYSARLGLMPPDETQRVRAHLESAGFITDLRALPGAPFDADKTLALMAGDKKAEAGRLTLVLARGIGKAFVQKEADAGALRTFLEEELK